MFSIIAIPAYGWTVCYFKIRERKVIRLRNVIAHTKKYAVASLLSFFCVTWQLRAAARCVNPFVAVVIKAMIQKHNLVITTNRKFDTKTSKLPHEIKVNRKFVFTSSRQATIFAQHMPIGWTHVTSEPTYMRLINLGASSKPLILSMTAYQLASRK